MLLYTTLYLKRLFIMKPRPIFSVFVSLGLLFWCFVVVACDESSSRDVDRDDQRVKGVYGGETVLDSELLGFNNAIVSLNSNGCSGVLVAPRLVLTAAHCGEQGIWEAEGGNKRVTFGADTRAGLQTIRVLRELDFPVDPHAYDEKGQKNSFDKDRESDLGLWVLETPSHAALPFWNFDAIDTATGNLEEGALTSMYGFGSARTVQEEIDGLPNPHQGPRGPLRSAAGCEITEEPYVRELNGSNSVRFGIDNCKTAVGMENGDSGGPVFDSQNRQIGINVNFGLTHQTPQFIGGRYLDWIQEHIEAHKTRVVLGDFNGDGRNDVLHWNEHGNGSWIDLSSNRALPDSKTIVPVEGCRGMAYGADINGDGRDDLVCQTVGSRYSAVLGRSLTTLNISVRYAAQFAPDRFSGFGDPVELPFGCAGNLFFGEFDGVLQNGARRKDLVCQDREAGQIRMYVNTGSFNAPFEQAPSWVDANDWCRNSDLRVADFDGDQKDDLLCWSEPENWFSIRYSVHQAASWWNTWKATTFFQQEIKKRTAWCGQELFVGALDDRPGADLLCWSSGMDRVWIQYAAADREKVPFDFTSSDWSAELSNDWCSKDDETFFLAEMTGNARDDLVCYNDDTGLVLVDQNRTTRFNGRPEFLIPKL